MCKRDFKAKDGKTYQISIDVAGVLISVRLGGVLMGTIELDHGEMDMGYKGYYEWFHIISLSLDGCKRLGIGRECLVLHKETFGVAITAGESDGHQSSDGSHLTGDGAPFIAQMRKEGIVEKSRYDDDSDESGSFEDIDS